MKSSGTLEILENSHKLGCTQDVKEREQTGKVATLRKWKERLELSGKAKTLSIKGFRGKVRSPVLDI